MVLLVEKLSRGLRFPSRLDNHHKDQKPEAALSASSLYAFRSEISSFLNRLISNSEPGTDFLTLERLRQVLGSISSINNKAFASLVACINYPISKWEASNVEEYLNYSLNLLELLNSVSSCVSHLSQDRLALAHTLSRLTEHPAGSETRNLKRVQPKDPGKHFNVDDGQERSEKNNLSEKGLIIHQALLSMTSISMFVFGIVLTGLCSDAKQYEKMRKLAARFDDSLIQSADSRVGKMIVEKKGEVNEVKGVNDAADRLREAIGKRDVQIAAKELKTRLEMFEKLLKGLEKESNDLFAEILAARNNLLDGIRTTCMSSKE